LFVGFSLNDDNFHRIVDAVRRALARTDRSRLGTVVTLNADPLFEQLWGDDLEWVHVDAPSLPEAARRFELFLDAVSRTTATSGHLLNPRFAGLLSPPEVELAGLLEPLATWAESVRGVPELAATRAVVQAFLRELGG
ncbi:MAG: hypothetical protein KC656_35225, partial [Myxococcales bacterium]|nr:hypothetical protein [Myxococcales bacterium]